MKTKNLLTAIALPALFAACTAEEIVTVNNAEMKEDLSSRVVVENVTLGMGETESRAAKGEGYNEIVYTAGDKVGALLVDEIKTSGLSSSDFISNYTLLANSFNTNYIFETEDGANFASEAYMVEGNYVFYFPYNDQRTRSSVWAKLPKSQKLTLQADGTYSSFADVLAKSEEAGAPMLVGYDFINRADADKTIAAAMKQIYATPEITIMNTYKEDITPDDGKANPVARPVTIQEIVLSLSSGQFTLNAPLKFSANGNTAWGEAANGASKSIVNVLFNEAIPSTMVNSHSKGVWTSASIDPTKARYTSDVLDYNNAAIVAADKSSEIILTLDEPITIAANGKLTIYPVIPAADYTSNALQIQMVNAAGESNTPAIMGAASLFQGRRYPAEEYTGSSVNDDVKGSTLTAYVSSYNTLSGVRVSTVDELINAIKAHNTATTLKLRVAGDAVINSRVAALLNSTSTYTKATQIRFVNEVAMEGTFTLNPTTRVVFEGGVKANANSVVTINATNATSGYSNFSLASSQKLTIANGATLTYKEAYTANAAIDNYGTLKLDNAAAVVDGVVNNYGTLAIVKDATFSTINNGKSNGSVAATIEVPADKVLNATEINNYANSTIDNLGTITAELLNNGTINNGSEENSTAIFNASGAGSLNQTAGYSNAPTAVINNYAVLSIEKNNSKINMLSVNAAVEVTDATTSGTGTIDNQYLGSVTLTTTGNKVTYTLTGSKTHDLKTDVLALNSINTVIMKNVTVTATDNVDFKNLNVEVQGNLTFNSGKGSAAKLKIVNVGTIKITTSTSKLVVNKGINFYNGTTDAATVIAPTLDGYTDNYTNNN